MSASPGCAVCIARSIARSPSIATELAAHRRGSSAKPGRNGSNRMAFGHRSRDLLALRQRQGCCCSRSHRWSDATSLDEDALNGGVGSIEQLSDLVQCPTLLPSLPHQRLLGLRVVDASSLLHLQHPCCLCSDQCVASTS